MKKLIKLTALFSVVALLMFGCGKTDEQKKMESDLNDEIQKLHDDGMELSTELSSIQADLSAKLAKKDSLANAVAKELAGTSTEAVNASIAKIKSSTEAMNNWMMNHKGYDEKAKHEEVIATLTTEKEAVSKVKTELEAALTDAKSTVSTLDSAIAELAAKKPAKGKKK